MLTYRALVEGRNFLLNVDGKTRRHGFYQTVYVQAADAKEAESNAIGAVKGDNGLKQMTLNEPGDPPMLHLDSLAEMEDSESTPAPNGRTYYVEKHWWQFWL